MAEELLIAGEKESKLKPPESGADFNVIEDVIYRRRSVRFYKKKQVPEYLVRRLMETARFAPSAGNGQTWKFIVIQDRNMIKEMTDDVVWVCSWIKRFSDYYKTGSTLKEWSAKVMQHAANGFFHPIPLLAAKLIAEGKLGLWHGAPTVILILADKRSPGHPVLDVGIAGQNLVLTAHSYGLATCWVSFCTPLKFLPKWRKKLGIRHPYELVTSIAMGFPHGIPDGYVKRETSAVDWFGEDGSFKVVY
jgi:nitroreductase